MTESDLKRIREFLEFAKSVAPKGVALEQNFDGFYVVYDGYWTRYRAVGDFVRCQIPEDYSMITDLPECARNCWKLLMFRKKPEDVEASVTFLLPLLKNGKIKSFKQIVTERYKFTQRTKRQFTLLSSILGGQKKGTKSKQNCILLVLPIFPIGEVVKPSRVVSGIGKKGLETRNDKVPNI